MNGEVSRDLQDLQRHIFSAAQFQKYPWTIELEKLLVTKHVAASWSLNNAWMQHYFQQ